MVTFTEVEHDPFEAAAPAAQNPGVGLVGRQTLGPNSPVPPSAASPPAFATAGATPAPSAPSAPSPALPGAGATANPTPAPKFTPVEHDPFEGDAPAAPVQPTTAIGEMYRAEQERMQSAAQMTSPDARDPATGELTRPVLGKAYQLDDLNVYYDGADGKPVRADKARHVVQRDPKTNELMVFERTPETDQSRFLSMGQMVAPGLVTGPVTAALRGAGPTNRAANIARATEVEQDAAAFERHGVRPFGPAFGQGPVAATAKQITEMPVVGTTTAKALTQSIEGARDATRGVASGMGGSRTEAEAGNVVQAGIERFKDARPVDVINDRIANLPDAEVDDIIARPASATSLKTKQGAMYEKAWRSIPAVMRDEQALNMRKGRAVKDETRTMQNPTNTRAVLQDIIGRNSRMVQQSGEGRVPDSALRPVTAGLLGHMIDGVLNAKRTVSLQSLRDMRSEFRRLASGMSDAEKNVLKSSDLDRIQAGITEDMVALLQRNADHYRSVGDTAKAASFERSIAEFRGADTYTRQAMERMDVIERLFKAESAEALARTIKTAALAGGKGNEEMLIVLARTLRPEELREVASMVLHNMGTPAAGAKGETARIGWSVMQAMTNFRAMSERARAILFPGEWGQAINELERINTRLANVEALANSSRTLSNSLGIGSIVAGTTAAFSGGIGAVAAALGTAGTLATASLIFSRPSYVKWVIGWTRLKAAGSNPQTGGRIAAELAQLGRMAQADPQLLPFYRALAAENGVAPNPEGAERQ
jgi:hypothetical protein